MESTISCRRLRSRPAFGTLTRATTPIIARETSATEALPLTSISWLACRESHSSRSDRLRSEEHTSELQSLMRISYAVFCLQKKKYNQNDMYIHISTKMT